MLSVSALNEAVGQARLSGCTHFMEVSHPEKGSRAVGIKKPEGECDHSFQNRVEATQAAAGVQVVLFARLNGANGPA